MTTHAFHVEWMICAHCVRALEVELAAEPNCYEVDIDANLQSMTVTGDSVDSERVLAAIDRAGTAVSARFASNAQTNHGCDAA